MPQEPHLRHDAYEAPYNGFKVVAYWPSFMFVIDGSVEMAAHEATVREGSFVLLGKGTSVSAVAGGSQESRFVVIVGRPTGAPAFVAGPVAFGSREKL